MKLFGYARDDDGTPIEGATVEVFQDGSPTPFDSSTTNASGYWEFSSLPSGHSYQTKLTFGMSVRYIDPDVAIQVAEIVGLDGTSAPLPSGSVTTSMLALGAVGTNQLADNAVTAAKLATNAVETDRIADEAVTTNKLADGAVTSDKLAAGAVNLLSEINAPSGNVNLPSGGSTVTITSVSLDPGTWLVVAPVTVSSGSATLQLTDGSSVYAESRDSSTLAALVTLASTTTINLTGKSNSGFSGATVSGSANKPTQLVAIRIA